MLNRSFATAPVGFDPWPTLATRIYKYHRLLEGSGSGIFVLK